MSKEEFVLSEKIADSDNLNGCDVLLEEDVKEFIKILEEKAIPIDEASFGELWISIATLKKIAGKELCE